MKAMIRHVKNGELKYDCLAFVCPGCKDDHHTGLHMLPVNTDVISPAWSWDGNLEKPTLSPSINSTGHLTRCHSFLNNGVFEFLSDCTHKLANQHEEMGDLPDWFVKEHESEEIF